MTNLEKAVAPRNQGTGSLRKLKPADVELIKANVLTYLRTAQEHLDAAMKILPGDCELRNQIHAEVDAPLDGIVYSLEQNEYADDEIVGRRA